MTRFSDRLRRVPILAWITVGIVIAWVVFGGVMWVNASGTRGAAAAPPSSSPSPTATSITTPGSAIPAIAAARASACSASADVTNRWEGDFQIDVVVTATGGAISDWTVALDLGSATVAGAWNSTLAAGATGKVTASDLGYNGAVPTNKLVYSPHDYGPLVYEQPWFQGAFTATSLRTEASGPNWLYLNDNATAPLLIGEWGGRLGQDPRQDA